MTTTVSAYYVDTCLSDYLQDGHNRDGECLCSTSLGCGIEDAVDSMYDHIAWEAGIPEEITDEQIKAALREALQGVDLRYIDEDGNRQEEPAEDRDHEEPLVYVVLKWDPRE